MPSTFPGVKAGNEYAASLERYNDIPKAVFAAIAVSYMSAGGDNFDVVEANMLREWWALHNSGIVPQKPYRALTSPEL